MMLDLDAYAFRYLRPYTNTRNEQMDTNGKAVWICVQIYAISSQ